MSKSGFFFVVLEDDVPPASLLEMVEAADLPCFVLRESSLSTFSNSNLVYSSSASIRDSSSSTRSTLGSPTFLVRWESSFDEAGLDDWFEETVREAYDVKALFDLEAFDEIYFEELLDELLEDDIG